MLDYQGEVFGTCADDVIRFVASTRPAPSAEDVQAHVAWLDREGLVTKADLARLAAAGYGLPNR